MAAARFDPSALGLPGDFLLTDYTRLKGCSCKVPQNQLLLLLSTLNPSRKEVDVGMDCSIVPLKTHRRAATVDGATGDTTRVESLYQVSTTDFFAPSVEDPYLQGRIACANVLSDLYALGVVHCDSLLMILAASTDMEEDERFTVTLEIMRGFSDAARSVDVDVTGGQSIMNPWPLIGGTAMAVCSNQEIIRPNGLQAGDVLVLTKPLGAQLAVNLQQWRKRRTPLYVDNVEGKMTEDEIEALYSMAAGQMARLNRPAAVLMRKHGAHGCTDVTGFGLYGHASNLALAQRAEDPDAPLPPRDLGIVITRLPFYAGALKGESLINNKYKLRQGRSAETSGGLLVALPSHDAAAAYIAELALAEPDAPAAHIVGRVVAVDELEQRFAADEFAEGSTFTERVGMVKAMDVVSV